jgi:general secretion pathway protein K
MPTFHLPSRSRGAALIVALMVVALVAVIGASMGFEYLITVKRSSNQLVGEQAYSYALAAEAIAVKALRVDLMQDQLEEGVRSDSLDEFWAKDVPPFQTAEGAYGGKLIDLGGRFNINCLIDTKQGAQGSNPPPANQANGVRTINEGRFLRLLISLSDEEGEFVVLPEQALEIVQAVVDWLDADSNPTGFGGAEDDYYSGLQDRPPYRAANGPMTSTSELLLVAHMTPEIYKRLLPHVTVWPAVVGSTDVINLNTATANVLRSLNVTKETLDGIPATGEQVAPLLEAQQQEGGITQEEIQSVLPGADTAGLGISSDTFLLDGHVTLGDVATHMQSVISRKGGVVQVIVRSSGGL